MLGFHAVSATPLSTSAAKVVHTGSTSLSVSSSQSVIFTKLGIANIGGLPFTLGFDAGFEATGAKLFGNGFIVQNHLDAIVSLVANGTVEKIASISLSPSISIASVPQLQISGITSPQTVGSLSGNSVLLIGGLADLSPLVLLQGALSTGLDNFDEVDLTLYLDKIRELSAYIDTTRSLTSYIDKQREINLYLDKTLSPTHYIDKQKSFELVREK